MSHPDPPDGDIPMQEPDRPRGYTVPFPPEPPHKVDEHGNITLEFWSDIRDKYTVRLSDDKTYFDIRELDDDDPTGMGRRFEGDWPKMYSMGPPSEAPDYNPIFEKFGLKILNAAGFINCVQPCDSITFGPLGRLYGKPYRNPTWDPAEKIHPIFRRQMWHGITDEIYALLQPSLNLASAILDDPTTLSYFYALRQPAGSMSTVVDPDTYLTCKITDIPNILTEAQQLDTFQAIWDMQFYTYFGFAEMGPDYDCYGRTRLNLDSNARIIPASGPNTRCSIVELSNRYIWWLIEMSRLTATGQAANINWFQEVQRMFRVPAHKREHIDLTSAYFRITLMLACTVLHELVHAFSNAYFENPTPLAQPREPWIRGTRCNEQGCCFEQFIFGGLPRAMIIGIPPISHRYNSDQTIAMPFGAFFEQQWDQWFVQLADDNSCVMPSVNKADSNQPRRLYPIVQEWFQRIHSDAMWMDQVQRFGMEAIKMPKVPLWQVMLWERTQRGFWGTGEERWNRNEPFGRTHNWV
ncbi:hypothetical protein KCU73_g2603, partial [Aureobasidium melanogenum]